jgi:hypothetical protein
MQVPIGLLFWVMMILWLFSWIATRFGGWSGPYVHASELLLFVLLFLLGWHDFGFIVRG